MKIRITSAILIMGFSGVVAQVLLLRELLITFQGNELSIGIILANWLMLEALGAFFLGKKIERTKNKIETFVGVQLLFALCFIVAIYFSRTLKTFIGVTPGEALGLLPMLLSSFFILLLVSLTHGALFTFSCTLYNTVNRTSRGALSIGRVYVYETVGTLVGGIVFTYLLIPHFHAVNIAFLIAVLNVLVCFVLLGRFWQSAQILTKLLGFSSFVLFLSLCFLLFTHGTDSIQRSSIARQWRGQNVVHYENSVYGNVMAIKREEQYTFLSDGVPVLTTPTPDIVSVEEFVHLPMLHHPAPKEILIISGGAGGVISEVMKHPVERIDYVELDPLILEVVEKYPTRLTDAELTFPKLKIHHLDGRYFVRATKNLYDLILVGLSNPQDLQVNRLFTKEFFSLAKNRLKQNGVMVLGVPGSLTYLSEELKNLNRCILNTAYDVFPYVKVIPGDGRNLYLTSESKEVLLADHGVLVERLDERNLEVRLLTPFHIEYKMHPRWSDWFATSVQHGTEKINEDFRPLGVFYSLMYWNAVFSPRLTGIFRYFEGMSLQTFAILLMAITLLFLAARTKVSSLGRLSIPLCIFTTGLAGMLFDLVLIFAFQTLYGYVFYWIGILVSAFMVGVAVGGYIATSYVSRIKRHFIVFSGIELSIIIFSVILILVFLNTDVTLGSPVLFIPIAVISGVLIGLEFPLANAIHLSTKGKPEVSHTAGLLYSMDLIGGWLGGVIGGVILLPTLGLLATCGLIFMLKVSTFIILVSSASTFRKIVP
jgi:spermidine synthase